MKRLLQEIGLILGVLAYTLFIFRIGMASQRVHSEQTTFNEMLVRNQLAEAFKQGYGTGMDDYREMQISLGRVEDVAGLDREILSVLKFRKNCNDTENSILPKQMYPLP